MEKKIVHPVLSMLMLISLSCNKNQFGIEFSLNYPLQEGLTWQYQRTIKFSNFRPFIQDTYFKQTEENYYIIINSRGKEVIKDGTLTYVLSAHSVNPLDTLISNNYYISTSGGLFRYAYNANINNGAIALPKHSKTLFTFNGKDYLDHKSLINFLDFQSITSFDTLIIEKSPRLVYSYPMKVGKKWIFTENDFMKIEKEIIDVDTVHTPIGIFNAFKIKWKYKIYTITKNSNIEAIEYVSNIGLVKRTFFINDLVVYRDNIPEAIGLINFMDETIITGY